MNPPTARPATDTGPFAGTPINESGALTNGRFDFTSPDGHFACGIVSAQGSAPAHAGCQGKTTPIPARPSDCSTVTGWGTGITVDAHGAVSFICAGDVEYNPRSKALPEGQSVAALGFTCAVRQDGVWCRDDSSGHGFRIASGSNATF